MNIFTIGFTQKSAEEFFTLLAKNNIECLIDVRLNNISQLAGFAKAKDLQYFLNIGQVIFGDNTVPYFLNKVDKYYYSHLNLLKTVVRHALF